jgi:hypothetical protein
MRRPRNVRVNASSLFGVSKKTNGENGPEFSGGGEGERLAVIFTLVV